MRKQIVLLAAAISLAASATRIGSAAVSEPAGLPNGGVWKDADGVRINAHGGGLLKDGDTWYWYGEHKVAGKVGNRAQVGVGCYSSKDLLRWKNEGIALRVSSEEGHDIEKDCILERPKVVKAPATGKYAMLFHLERKGRGYNDARVGFAVSDSPIGPFTFVRSCRPVDGKMMSRDMTVFVDDDGSVWHIFASESNATLHFAELTRDCLGYTGRWHRGAEKHWTEAPAVVKHGGWYWLLGSGCTGWKPNAARIYRAKSLTGPWEWMGNPCTGVNPANMLGADKTWGGQSTFIFHDGKTGRDVACFDIWNPKDAIDGRYVWLPITWHGDGLPEIPWRDGWTANDRDDLTLRGGPNSIWGIYQWGVEVDGFVQELFGNQDAGAKSRYAYKDVGGKLVWGPVWDFDHAAGTSNMQRPSPERWHAAQGSMYCEWLSDYRFARRARAKYNQIRGAYAALAANGGAIDQFADYLRESAEANDARWPQNRTFAQDVSILKNFISGHKAWLDGQFSSVTGLLESVRCEAQTSPWDGTIPTDGTSVILR